MRFPIWPILLTALAVISAAGCGGSKRAATLPQPKPFILSFPQCTSSQLRASATLPGAAAGTVFMSIVLRNTGSACRLKGYPSLRIEGTEGPLPTHAIDGKGPTRRQSETPRRVSLAHLGLANMIVSYSDVPTGKGSCSATVAIGVRPPGTRSWLKADLKAGVCDRGILHTSPVLAGARTSV